MVLETIFISMISSLCYDLLKTSGSIVKDKFVKSINELHPDYSEDFLYMVANEIEQLELNDEMSEKAIESKIKEKESLVNLISNQEVQPIKNIIQNNVHGDNIARDKIINN